MRGGIICDLREGGGYLPGQEWQDSLTGLRGNDYEIYTVNSRGGDKDQVTNSNTDDSSPSYSPGGKRIAYMVYSNVTGEDIYTINAYPRSANFAITGF